MAKKKRKGLIHINTIYLAEAGRHIKSPFWRGVVDFVFHRKVPASEISCAGFDLSFLGTENEWYSHTLNSYYVRFRKSVTCFFTKDGTDPVRSPTSKMSAGVPAHPTSNGAEIIVFRITGNPEAKSFFTMPKEKKGYVEDRTKEIRKKKKSLKIEKESIQEERTETDYRLQYEGEWKNHGKDFRLFEYTIFHGVDKVVFRAIVPMSASQSIFADIQKIAKSIQMN